MSGQRLCLWSGPAFVVVFGLGFILSAGFMPAPSPSLPTEAVATLYRDHSVGIRVGCALMMFAAGLLIPWAGLISAQMKRMGDCSIALVYTQLASGVAVVPVFLMSIMFWLAAAFRVERDSVLTQMLNDVAWLSLITPVVTLVIQVATLGFAILVDRAAFPVFPRWAGFYNLWTASTFIPGVTAMFVRTGPFAWNGLLPYWIPFAVFGAWFPVMFFLLSAAIRKQEAGAMSSGGTH